MNTFKDSMVVKVSEDKYEVRVNSVTWYIIQRSPEVGGNWAVYAALDTEYKFPLDVDSHRHDIFERFKLGRFQGFGDFTGRVVQCGNCGRFVPADVASNAAPHLLLTGGVCDRAAADRSLRKDYQEWAKRFWSAKRTLDACWPNLYLAVQDAQYSALLRQTLSYGSPLLKLFEIRAFSVDLNPNPAATVFLVSTLESVGEVIMYVYALKYRAMQNGTNRLSLEDVATFAHEGFIEKTALKSLWQEQKLSGNNLLDFLDRRNIAGD